MTALQINADIYRSLGIIAEDEKLLARASKYLKRLAAKKEDPTLMTREEFFAKVDESLDQIERGEYTQISGKAELHNWFNSL